MENINKLIIESYYNNIINESSGSDFLNDLDRYIDESQLLDWLWKEHKIDLYSGEISEMSDEEVDKIKNLMKKSAKEYANKILDTEGDKVNIYRNMVVTPNWFMGLRSGESNLGKYWTYDSEMAHGYDSEEMFDGKNGIDVTITATVNKNDVDIFETFLYSFYNQNELRLKTKDAVLDNIEIQGYSDRYFEMANADKISLVVDKINSKLKGKTFKL